MEVREEDLLELDQADRAHELALRALAAVEEQPVAAAPDERGRAARAGRWAPSRRCRGRGRRGPCRPILSGQELRTSSNLEPAGGAARGPIVWRGWRRRSVGLPGVEDLEAVGAPRAAGCASGRRRPRRRPGSARIRSRRPRRRAGVVHHRDPGAAGLHHALRGQQRGAARRRRRCRARPSPAGRSPRSRPASWPCITSPAWRSRSAPRVRSTHASAAAAARAGDACRR